MHILSWLQYSSLLQTMLKSTILFYPLEMHHMLISVAFEPGFIIMVKIMSLIQLCQSSHILTLDWI